MDIIAPNFPALRRNAILRQQKYKLQSRRFSAKCIIRASVVESAVIKSLAVVPEGVGSHPVSRSPVPYQCRLIALTTLASTMDRKASYKAFHNRGHVLSVADGRGFLFQGDLLSHILLFQMALFLKMSLPQLLKALKDVQLRQ